MLHPQPGHAESAPRTPSDAAGDATDQQLPIDAADERAAHEPPPPPDALQQARDLLAAGETSAAATNIRALIAREPKNIAARAMLAVHGDNHRAKARQVIPVRFGRLKPQQ